MTLSLMKTSLQIAQSDVTLEKISEGLEDLAQIIRTNGKQLSEEIELTGGLLRNRLELVEESILVLQKLSDVSGNIDDILSKRLDGLTERLDDVSTALDKLKEANKGVWSNLFSSMKRLY